MLTATPGSPLSSAPAPESPNSIQSKTAEDNDEKVSDLWTTERYYSFLTGHNEWEEISEEARKKQRTESGVSLASVPILAEVAAEVETAAPAAIVVKRAKKPAKPTTKDKPDAQEQHLQALKEGALSGQFNPDAMAPTQCSWTDTEDKKLADLVAMYRQVVPHPIEKKRNKGITQEITDWKTIGARLKKPPVECVRRWNKIESAVSKTGPFTVAEDALIKQRVSENIGQGVWAALQREMGRSAGVIRQRWFSCLSGKK